MLLALSACRAAPAPVRSLDPNADVVVPVDLDVTVGSVAVRGPISARVFASGLDGERTVRALAGPDLAAAQVGPGEKRTLRFTWDGREQSGAYVAAETYSLTLDFIVGGDAVRLGSVIEVRAP